MLLDCLDRFIADPTASSLEPLHELMDYLRPSARENSDAAMLRLQILIGTLSQHAIYRDALCHYLGAIMGRHRQIRLYTDIGLLGNETVTSGIWRRLGERLIPPLQDDSSLSDLFSRLTRRGKDSHWIGDIPGELWGSLFALLRHCHDTPAHATHARQQQLEALRVLAHRISALGLEPELVRSYPVVEALESPFLALNAETERYVREQNGLLLEQCLDAIDARQIDVLMAQCREVIRRVRKLAGSQGVSVSLTTVLVRLEQSLDRLELILALLDADDSNAPLLLAQCWQTLAAGELQSHSIRALLSRNTQLLARNITEHASETGDHYITTGREDFRQLGLSAAKGGVIIAVMALLKVLSARLVMAPFTQAFLHSMNYSLGFMLIHMVHGTVATKQPAMTASHLATSVEGLPRRQAEKHLGELALLCISVFRSQFIAILGNIGIAFPVALSIALLWAGVQGSSPASEAKALRLLHELDPLHSLSLFHAAIAGFFLFLSGLIAGYYDNKAIYAQIPERIAAAPWMRWLSESGRRRLAHYLRLNLGALAGNFYFGIMLGSTATIGYILGLPLDIRHIAFAAANFAYALAALDFMITWQTALFTIAGIAAIGLTNLGVSFTLALMLALKSRGVKFRLWLPLLRLIGQHLWRHPRDFFWPPATTAS